jgi:hypothetical protein
VIARAERGHIKPCALPWAVGKATCWFEPVCGRRRGNRLLCENWWLTGRRLTASTLNPAGAIMAGELEPDLVCRWRASGGRTGPDKLTKSTN